MIKTRGRAWYFTTLLGLLVVSLSLAIIAGCSKSPVEPIDTSTQARLDWANEYFGDAGPSAASSVNLNKCPVLYDTTIVQLVSPYGCQMNVVNGNEVIGISAPSEAVKVPTTLTIHVTKYQALFGNFWVFDCGPNGQVFGNPLYIQPNQAAVSNSVVVLMYLNPATGQWIVLQTASRSANTQFPVYHFSKYAIS
jgi:hypothetical protein